MDPKTPARETSQDRATLLTEDVSVASRKRKATHVSPIKESGYYSFRTRTLYKDRPHETKVIDSESRNASQELVRQRKGYGDLEYIKIAKAQKGLEKPARVQESHDIQPSNSEDQVPKFANSSNVKHTEKSIRIVQSLPDIQKSSLLSRHRACNRVCQEMPLPVLRETQNKIWPRHEDETLFSIVNGELPYDISSRESCSKMWDDIHRAYIIELPQSKRTKEELRAYWLEQGGRDMQLNESEREAFVNAAEDIEEEETVRLIIYRYHQLTSKWLAYPAAKRHYRDLKRHKREQREKHRIKIVESANIRCDAFVSTASVENKTAGFDGNV